MARAIRQRMPRVAESFGGCSAEAGGTRGRVTCQERGQWAPGGVASWACLCAECFLSWQRGWSRFSLPDAGSLELCLQWGEGWVISEADRGPSCPQSLPSSPEGCSLMKVRLTSTGTPLPASASLREAAAFTALLSPLLPQLHLK